MASTHGRRQSQTACRTGLREMVDDLVGLGDLPQGRSWMTFLPARRLVRWFAQTLDPSRLVQPVARRRLAAVGAVQSEPALEIGDPSLQSRNLGRLRPDQRNQLFPRWRARRLSIDESLNRNKIPLSRKIFRLASEKRLPRLGSYAC